MDDIQQQAIEIFDYTRALRRDLHRHPELALQEVRTAGIVARELGQLGMEVMTGIAQTGVVALLEGAQPGPVVLLRFDMDALPILEQTGAEYASTNPGVMHACGHDGHVAIGLSVARLLQQRREQIKGTVKFVFQPAEEGMNGAERMIEAGIMENPRVERTLAMHIWNEMPVGWVGITDGPLMAGADRFDVHLEGKGGHGALPHNTIDPVIAAAQIISALQTVVARNISPMETAVVSVCQVKTGDAFNVIPQSAEMSGTFRTFDPAVRQKVIERFDTLVTGLADALGCKADINLMRLTPAVMNDTGVTQTVREAVQTLPGLHFERGYRTMISEDMAYMMEKAPGCYLLVGSANPEKGLNYGHHHPKFDFDETVLKNGVVIMTTAAMKLLGS